MTATGATQGARSRFHLEDATIASIQQAITTRQITTVSLVELYLKRIKAYNGTCVNEPQGILGPVTTIPAAGQTQRAVNAQSEAGRPEAVGLRRSQGTQPDRSR